MAIWKFIPTDEHELTHLLELEDYFLENSLTKLNELKKAKALQKYGLPNWRTEVLRREVGYLEAYESLENVRKALKHKIGNTL